jgi:hypothetical protein
LDDNPVTAEPATTGPSCPFCATNHKVGRDKLGGSPDGRISGRMVYLCGSCWTVFTSGQHEWDRSREIRERRRMWVENGYAVAPKNNEEAAA